MQAAPKSFAELSPERQQNLLSHMESEFNDTEESAKAAFQTMCETEFLLHLEAAEEGYI